jgi:ACS family tartrate transporter-like MFS transporter
MITWGLITCAMMLVRGPLGLYVLRILLGFAEAGFFPGIILYLTYWFPARERGRIVALFMAGSPVTGIVGNPLSGAIMDALDGVGGLRGWQWVFLLEGLPAVILGIVVFYYLTDRPEQADWLTPEEISWLTAQLAREEKHRREFHGLSLTQALADGRVWLLILLYCTVAAGSNAFGSYLPTLIDTRFPGRAKWEIGLLAAIPNLCALVFMVLNGTHSDRTGERRWHVAIPAFVSALGWALCAWLESPIASLFALTLVQVGIMCMLPVFWTLPTAFLSGLAAAGGIALINSVGNLGGFAGPNILSLSKDLTEEFTSGLRILAVVLCVGGFLALSVRHDYTLERKGQ